LDEKEIGRADGFGDRRLLSNPPIRRVPGSPLLRDLIPHVDLEIDSRLYYGFFLIAEGRSV